MQVKTSKNGGRTNVEDMRERILSAALDLLQAGGRDSVTTRAVAEAAGVQPPALYRQFKDKQELLEAMAEHGFSRYLVQKREGPVRRGALETLREGWDEHIEFGLRHPMLYLLMYAEPRQGKMSAAAEHAFAMLREHVGRVAAAGRLRVTVEQAVRLYHAAAVGVVLLLLNAAEGERDLTISRMAREAALAAITKVKKATGSRSAKSQAAVTLVAGLDEGAGFSKPELALLREWLERIAKEG